MASLFNLRRKPVTGPVPAIDLAKASDEDAQGLTNDVRFMTPSKVVKQLQKLGYVTPEMFASADAATPGNNWYSIKAAVDFARTNGIPRVRGMKGPYTMNIPGSTPAQKGAALINATGVMVDFTGSKIFYNYGKAPLFYWYKNYDGGAGLRGHFVFTGPQIGEFIGATDMDAKQYATYIGVPGATGSNSGLCLNRSDLWTIAQAVSSDNLDIEIDVESATPCTLTDTSGTICCAVQLSGHYEYGWESTTWRADWRNAVNNRVVVRAADTNFPFSCWGQTGLSAYITSRRRPGITTSAQMGPGHVVYNTTRLIQTGTDYEVLSDSCDITSIDLDDGAQRTSSNGQTLAPKSIINSHLVVVSKHAGGAIGSFGGTFSGNTVDVHWVYLGTDITGITSITSSAGEFNNNRIRAYIVCPNAPAVNYFGGGTIDASTGWAKSEGNEIDLYLACDFNIPAGSVLSALSPAISMNGGRNKIRATLRPTKPRDGASASRMRAAYIGNGESNDIAIRFVGPYMHNEFLDCNSDSPYTSLRLSVDPVDGSETLPVKVRDNRGLLRIDLSSVTGTPAVGDTVTGGTTGAVAYVVEATGTRLSAVQNGTSGYKRFKRGESVSMAGSGATATVSQVSGGSSYLVEAPHWRSAGVDAGSTTGLLNFRLPLPGVYDIEVELSNNGLSGRSFYSLKAVWGPDDSGAANLQLVGMPVSYGSHLSGQPTFSISKRGVVTVSYTKVGSYFGRWGAAWTLKNSLIQP